MAQPTRAFDVGEHHVRVFGDETPGRAFRGFFAGDELPGEHRMTEEGGAPEQVGELPADLVVVEVDGARFEAHRVPAGWFHLHTLPFQRFTTIDDVVAEIVRLIDLGVLRGGA